MKRKPAILVRAVLFFLLALAAYVAFNVYPILCDYLFGPPVVFRENADIALGLYPAGYASAAVFTNDDVCSFTEPAVLDRLRESLGKLKIRGTFFVVPAQFSAPGFRKNSPSAEALRRLAAAGHEIAQHGYAHFCDRNEPGGREGGAEMLLLNAPEQEKRIRAGREILAGLGFPPVGHRSPCFSGTEETFLALDRLGFLYGSDLNLPAAAPYTLLTPAFRGRVMFPYHPRGLELLEVTCQADPTVRPEKAREIFSRFHRRGGVFVFLTHLPQIAEKKNLRNLEEFIRYLRESDTWICRLDELCRWWRAREAVAVETTRAGDFLEIVCDNPSLFPLEEGEIVFKEPAPARYRLRMKSGRVVSEGEVPTNRRIEISIPAGSKKAEGRSQKWEVRSKSGVKCKV
jgi:peptidoglycan/xylan/chitin deacetylase (PgdA/CDA1 family)